MLLIATTNAGKLREIETILAGLDLELASLSDIPEVNEPEETGSTFEENARQKAAAYAAATGLTVVAEDSGLEIDALGGAPGVQSARFPGPTYPERFERIYRMLDERGVGTSTARFVCALAVVRDGRVLFETRGTVEGQIARPPRGAGGFGYDPIFFYAPYGCTLAEVDAGRKAEISHRGQAFRRLRAFIEGGGLQGGSRPHE